jgi:pilus assembly protein Flp/PilA
VNFRPVSPERGIALEQLFPVDELASLSPPKGKTQMELRRSWFQLHREDGQTMTEYGVLIALIAIVVIVAIIVLGPKVANLFSYVGSQL